MPAAALQRARSAARRIYSAIKIETSNLKRKIISCYQRFKLLLEIV